MPYANVVRALYSYEAAAEDEMSFAEDELLCVVGEKDIWDSSWFAACSLSGERQGLVPANYVEQVQRHA